MNLDALHTLFSENQHLLGWVTAGSLFMLIAGLICAPFAVSAIPYDYFSSEKRPGKRDNEPWAFYILRRLLKNIIGAVLIVGGILMLVLPGQGLLTLMVGLLLLDYPGKFKFEKALFSRPKILNAINWMRRKQGKQNLII